MPAAVVLYTYKGEYCATSSNTIALKVPKLNVVSVLSEGAALGWNDLVSLLNLILPPIGGNGSTVLSVAVIG